MSASSSLAGEMGDVPPDGPVDIDALEVGQVFLSTYLDRISWSCRFLLFRKQFVDKLCVLIPLKDREYEVQKCTLTFIYHSHTLVIETIVVRTYSLMSFTHFTQDDLPPLPPPPVRAPKLGDIK